MADETTPQAPETQAGAAEAKPAKAKKEKPPAVEDKPFPELIQQHFIPGLQQALGKIGIQDVDLRFEQRQLPIAGLGDTPLWQVIGQWQSDRRQFFFIFSQEDIQSPKYFCCSDSNASPSTLESWMIDERKVTLDLMLLYAIQRLNGQKWLVRN